MEWLLKWIESGVVGGRRFRPEQKVQIGWSWLEVRQRSDGTLAFFEPDFKSMPLKFIDSVTNTLLHLMLQKYVAESLGLEGEITIPPLVHSAIVCDVFGSTKGFIMSRVAPNASDSGWFFGCDNESHDHDSSAVLRRVSLYEAAVCKDDRIISFLGLPSDITVEFDGDAPCFSWKSHKIPIRPGSYLHKKYIEKHASE
ncbi:MAG TPA: hypothetical protein VG347_25680 [Verrucomicrobiae bacterium]|nr:hypothetical protein [Verrucomicrobiae bacterium]